MTTSSDETVTLLAVKAALCKWIPASEALVEKVMAELAGPAVDTQPAEASPS